MPGCAQNALVLPSFSRHQARTTENSGAQTSRNHCIAASASVDNPPFFDENTRILSGDTDASSAAPIASIKDYPMRIPDPFFPFINVVTKALLNSPLHGLMSDSLMVIYFTGRKTGKPYTTPVRYLCEDAETLVCLTGHANRWWPNFHAPTAVELQLAGIRQLATAHAHPDDTERKAATLRRMLADYPADAAYHGIRVKRNQTPTEEQVWEAARNTVLVTFTLVPKPRVAANNP